MLRHGKYKGRTLEYVLQHDRKYCAWLIDAGRHQTLPRDFQKFARTIEQRHGGVLQVGAHKQAFFDEVMDKHPSYGEWAATLTNPGDGISTFARYAKKRLSEDEAETGRKEKKPQARQPHDDGKCCVVCKDKPKECAFVPCGHMVTCARCAALVEADGCPVCRQEISMVLKIFT